MCHMFGYSRAVFFTKRPEGKLFTIKMKEILINTNETTNKYNNGICNLFEHQTCPSCNSIQH